MNVSVIFGQIARFLVNNCSKLLLKIVGNVIAQSSTASENKVNTAIAL